MNRCQHTGDVTGRLILDLFRRLPLKKQKAYLEGLQTCLKMENYRKAGLIVEGSDAGCLKRGETRLVKFKRERKPKDNAV